MSLRTPVNALIDRIAYYEWAYGRLAESDSDVGPIGEFLVGRLLNCLPPSRKVNSTYDLVLESEPSSGSALRRRRQSPARRPASGLGIEVKTTTHRVKYASRKTLGYRWDVKSQRANPKAVAPIWIFLSADFPDSASTDPRFDVFELKYWTARIVTGEQIVASGVKYYFTESTLARFGIGSFPLAELPDRILPFIVTKS